MFLPSVLPPVHIIFFMSLSIPSPEIQICFFLWLLYCTLGMQYLHFFTSILPEISWIFCHAVRTSLDAIARVPSASGIIILSLMLLSAEFRLLYFILLHINITGLTAEQTDTHLLLDRLMRGFMKERELGI